MHPLHRYLMLGQFGQVIAFLAGFFATFLRDRSVTLAEQALDVPSDHRIELK